MSPNIFGTKYPIICSPMFQVSNVALPVAVSLSGCLPIFHIMYKAHIEEFKTITNNANFGIFVNVSFKYNIENSDDILQFILATKPTVIEFSGDSYNSLLLEKILKLAQNNDIIIMEKLTNPKKSIVDTVDIKGSESAGSPGSYKLCDFFTKQKLISKHICCSGAISTSEQIDYYLEQGAAAVVLGTVFALTKESAIDEDVKNKLIQKNAEDLEKIYNKNAVIFDRNQVIDTSDPNGTAGLRLGVRNQGGHIYMGNAISNVKQIMPVKEVIDNLVMNSAYLSA